MPATQHNIQFIDIANDVVRVVQLTDTHLCHARGGTLLGMDTDHSLQAVLDLVKKERPQVHLLLGTGDLSDGGARPAYDRLQRYFDQLSPRNYWLPGNHGVRVTGCAGTGPVHAGLSAPPAGGDWLRLAG